MNLNTKIKLNNISLSQFCDAVLQIHGIKIPKQVLTPIDNGKIIFTNNIIAYQFQQNGLYEYIYDMTSEEAYIHIESNKKQHEIIDWFIAHQWVDVSHPLHLTHRPLIISQLSDITSIEGKFPIVYLHQDDYSEKNYQQLSSKLKGVAYVVYGNETMDELVAQYYHISRKSFAILFNGDLLDIKYSDVNHFISEIVRRIETYVNQRVYAYPFSFKQLYKEILLELIQEESIREQQNTSDYLFKVDNLKKKENELLDKISKLENDLTYIKMMNDVAKAELDAKKGHPLLFKGKEQDLYPNEQYDMILAILNEELSRIKDKEGYDEKRKLIFSILSVNPKSGERDQILYDIRDILEKMKRNLSSKELESLKRVGLDMKHAAGHYKGCFFDDPRYSMTMSSSASDAYSGAVVYRTIRNQFF